MSLPNLATTERRQIVEAILKLIGENARGSNDSIGSVAYDLERLGTYVEQVEAALSNE